MKRFWFLIPLAAFLALAVVLAVGLKLDPREVPSPLIDKPAPKFALPRLDDAGKTIRLDDMRGKVWVLNVWASWCVACREEHPLLVEFAKKQVVPLYGLNYKDKRDDATALAGPLRQSVRRVALRRRRPGRHRLRRLRRARDLRHRPGRRHPPEAHRPADARRAREQDRAAAEEARCLRRCRRRSSRCCSRSARRWRAAKEAAPEAADPALEARMTRITAELRCLVCQNQTIADSNAGLAVDLRRETREHAAPGQERRGDHRLHDRPLRRLRALPAAAEVDHRAALVRPGGDAAARRHGAAAGAAAADRSWPPTPSSPTRTTRPSARRSDPAPRPTPAAATARP